MDNAKSYLFRYQHLRRARPASHSEPLDDSTDLVVRLRRASSVRDLQQTASDALDRLRFDPARDALAAAVASVQAEAGSVEDLVSRARSHRDLAGADLGALRRQLSDAVVSERLARREGYRARTTANARLFVAASLLLGGAPGDTRLLSVALSAGTPLPALPTFVPEPVAAVGRPVATRTRRALLKETMEALLRLTGRGFLEVPQGAQAGTQEAFRLNVTGRQRLSQDVTALLRDLGADPERETLPRMISAVDAALAHESGREARPGGRLAVAAMAFAPSQIKASGVTDLLVVRQQIKRYEAAEIAHVENVLPGETRERIHRAFERVEETVVKLSESTTERENELETADRFELSRESTRVIAEDREAGFGLTVSGRYGASIEFSSNLDLATSESLQETTSNAQNYAKSVVERSRDRLVEKARSERTRTMVREAEETNRHEFSSPGGQLVTGIYQFLDKIYETQVFNYGLRQVFDFMIPEPASFLWYLEEVPRSDLSLPEPPRPLEDDVVDASEVDETNYLQLGARYGATGLEPPPPILSVVTNYVMHGDDDASETGEPRSIKTVEMEVPDGYFPWLAQVDAKALTDKDPTLVVSVGAQSLEWSPTALTTLTGSFKLGRSVTPLPLYVGGSDFRLEAEAKLPFTLLGYETNTYSASVSIICLRGHDKYEAWQIGTYEKIAEAYQTRVQEHAAAVAEILARAEAEQNRERSMPFGEPPTANQKMIRGELKKSCIAMMTNQFFDGFGSLDRSEPPGFDIAKARQDGSLIRFLEHAFEWEELQYVFYPYFWADKSTWNDRFVKRNVDPHLVEFLRAGEARVNVPVRPGFERAVSHYLENDADPDAIWDGAGEPPPLFDPLYFSIVDEIMERTQAPGDEKPEGDSWETRVPTPLVLARRREDLPAWEPVVPGEWRWREVPETPS